jgi:hypothetical protein
MATLVLQNKTKQGEARRCWSWANILEGLKIIF